MSFSLFTVKSSLILNDWYLFTSYFAFWMFYKDSSSSPSSLFFHSSSYLFLCSCEREKSLGHCTFGMWRLSGTDSSVIGLNTNLVRFTVFLPEATNAWSLIALPSFFIMDSFLGWFTMELSEAILNVYIASACDTSVSRNVSVFDTVLCLPVYIMSS